MEKSDAAKALDRTLRRQTWHQLRSGLRSIVVATCFFAIIAFAFGAVTAETSFHLAKVIATETYFDNGGPRQRTTVSIDGQDYQATTAELLLKPEAGETVCVQLKTRSPFGSVVATTAQMPFCRTANATSEVE